ncbi:MAG TPA: TetR/AcrR family transcriptional regulator [Streptosporangiaceae bacterium]|nr:TetR/AcrR family transcriptional regulator [Streptosporangiaceae bacterium]
MINEAAPQVETGTDVVSPAGGGTAAALERLFGRYHFPAGPRRILLAAATAFAERGFHATTTRDIAAQAGLSPAALYVYFRSKEEVLHQIVTSTLDFTIEVVATEARRPGSPADRLADLVQVLTLWTTYNSQVAHVVLYQTGALSPAHLADVASRQREVGELVRQVIADGIDSRDFDIPDPGAAATAVLSLCLDVARWYRPGHRLTPQQLGDFNAVAALRIVGGRLPEPAWSP